MAAGCALRGNGQHSCLHMSWQGQSSCETERRPQYHMAASSPKVQLPLWPTWLWTQTVSCSLRDDRSLLALLSCPPPAERQIFSSCWPKKFWMPVMCPCYAFKICLMENSSFFIKPAKKGSTMTLYEVYAKCFDKNHTHSEMKSYLLCCY